MKKQVRVAKFATLAVFLVFNFISSLSSARINDSYPKGPHPQVTPGTLCERASKRRYPEGIAYCERDVESSLKREIIQTYDRQFGFEIERMNRAQFKIDHLIPLCAGGGNERENLWPQHEKVYTITDPLEPAICNKMAQGRLKQAEAVRLVLAAKKDLTIVRKTLVYVNAL